MSTPSFPRLIAPIVIAIATISTVSVALAQGAAQRSEERRNRNRGAQQAPEERYPNATRTAPETRASVRAQPKLQRMLNAYEERDADKVLPIADEIIAGPRSNDYDKAFAARIAGAVLVDEDSARAEGYLKQALEFNGLNNNDHYETLLILGQLALQDDRYDDALVLLDQYLTETRSTRPEDLFYKGTALYRLERFAEATEVLKAAIDATPEPRNDWLQLLMAAYAESDQGDAAIALAEQLAASNPDNRRAQLNLAALYMQGDRDDEAIAVYERLRAAGQFTEERDYKNLSALYLNYKTADDEKGREAEAIAVLSEGLERGIVNRDYQTYLSLAQAYYYSDQIDQAIEYYGLAAPLAETGQMYLNLAIILSNEDRLDEAKQAAQQALDKGGLRDEQQAQRILTRRAR